MSPICACIIRQTIRGNNLNISFYTVNREHCVRGFTHTILITPIYISGTKIYYRHLLNSVKVKKARIIRNKGVSSLLNKPVYLSSFYS